MLVANEDPEYLNFVRERPCSAPGAPTGCSGRIEAHHNTATRGMGQRAHDRSAFALCTGHHRAFHDGSGPFKGWNKHERREWQQGAVEKTLEAFNRPPSAFPF